MGYSINAFIEYKRAGGYSLFSDGTIWFPRDSDLFTAMALGPGGNREVLPYPPRGLPTDLSYEARSFFYAPARKVIKGFEKFNREFLNREIKVDLKERVTRLDAWEYEEYKLNKVLLRSMDAVAYSWLNLRELKKVIVWANLNKRDFSPEFRAILAAMEQLAAGYGKEHVRLVFCITI